MSQLSSADRSRLRVLENTIGTGITASLKAGEAFLEIRDKRLYLGTDRSFNEYIKNRWGCGVNFAHKMIAAYETRQRLCTIVKVDSQVDSINTERQLREIASVPDDKLKDVVERSKEIASEGNGKISSDVLRQAREETLPPPVVRPGPAVDAAAARAKKKIPELVRSLRLQLDNLGLHDKFDAVLTKIEKEAAK